MLKVLFWVYIASAVIVFLYLYVFAWFATMYFTKECKAKGMVKVKNPTNWAKIFIAQIHSILMIGLPIVNTFIAIIWLCNTKKVMKEWEEQTLKMYCYPDKLS